MKTKQQESRMFLLQEKDFYGSWVTVAFTEKSREAVQWSAHEETMAEITGNQEDCNKRYLEI